MQTTGPPPRVEPAPMRRHRVWSATVPGKAYSVFAYNGRAVCDCIGHLTHGVNCRHINEVLMSDTEQAIVLDEEMSRALVPVEVRPASRSLMPTAGEMAAAKFIADTTTEAAGVAYPVGLTLPAVRVMVMLKGVLMGIDPFTAIRHMSVINGQIEPDAQLMMGLVRARATEVDGCPAEFQWFEVSGERARLRLLRRGKQVIDVEYSLEDAKRAGRFVDEADWPTRKKVKSWKKNQNGKSVPDEFVKDDNGRDVWEKQRPDSYWYTNTALALAYNAAKIACKLGAPDLINGLDSATPQAMLEEESQEEAAEWAKLESEWPANNVRSLSPAQRAIERPRITGEMVKAELQRQGVDPSRLGALVGGTTTTHVGAWMAAHPNDTLTSLVALAKGTLDAETGEWAEAEEEQEPVTA